MMHFIEYDNIVLSQHVQRIGRILRPVPGKRVKLFLVYVKNTLEEDNARNVRELIGEDSNAAF